MFLHGWASLPLSSHAKCVFLFGIPVHALAATAFFFTNFTRKRAHTFDKFIRFVLLDNDLYLIEKQIVLPALGLKGHSMLAVSPNSYYKDHAIKSNSENIILTN
jgi:hypothetical protein